MNVVIMKAALTAIIGILLLTLSLAANISGSFYSGYSFELYNGSVVLEMNGNQYYKGVFTENYSLELPPGEYNISAYSFNGNMVSQEEKVILDNQTHWDIILLYSDSIDVIDSEINDTIDVPGAPIKVQEKDYTIQNLLLMSFIFVLIAIILIVVSQKLEKKYDEEQDYELLKDKELTNDEKVFLETINGNEGVIVQKEMRKTLGWSDAKTSLISKSMEIQGFVKLVRKGRENIVKITEKGKEIILQKPQQE
jgi:uncharacterized membrane protein